MYFSLCIRKMKYNRSGLSIRGGGRVFPPTKNRKSVRLSTKIFNTFCELFYSCVVNSDKKLTFKRSSSFFLTTSEIKTLSAKKIWQKTYRFRIFCLVSAKKSYEDTFCQNSYTKQI